MSRIVILSAGKSSRLGGRNKLSLTAGGLPVLEWHRRFAEGMQAAIVTRPEDAGATALAAPWADRVIGHSEFDGPVGALAAYLRTYPEKETLRVIFADTLLPPQPLPSVDFVGIAPAPARRWDLPNYEGTFVRGTPLVEVCIGLYQFSDHPALIRAAEKATRDASCHGESEVGFYRLLNHYHSEQGLFHRRVRGWWDCGDEDARRRVPAWESVLVQEPYEDKIGALIPVGLTR